MNLPEHAVEYAWWLDPRVRFPLMSRHALKLT